MKAQFYIDRVGDDLYEAHAVIVEGSTNGRPLADALQFSIVVPHGTKLKLISSDQPRNKQDRRRHAKWNFPRNRVNAPKVTPDLDYMSAVFDTSPTQVYPELKKGTDLLLFKFRSSSDRIRLFRNNPNQDGFSEPSGPYDPTGGEPGMLGANFNNSFSAGGSTDECYAGNYEL